MPDVTTRPVAKTFVVEIEGIDLATQKDDKTIEYVMSQVNEHGVVVLHNQHLSAQDIAEIGRKMGKIEKHLFNQYVHEEVDEVSYVTNRTREGEIDEFGVTRASLWHVDEPYKENLPKFTMLHALEVPSVKGGTEFADAQGAYDALPEEMKERLKGLDSVFKVRQGFESEHPAVAIHPVTGRPGIFISPQHQVGFTGMVDEGGMELMNELLAHATQEQFTYYHHWKVGDVVIWDDIGTLHRNPADSDPKERRVFLRTIVH